MLDSNEIADGLSFSGLICPAPDEHVPLSQSSPHSAYPKGLAEYVVNTTVRVMIHEE